MEDIVVMMIVLGVFVTGIILWGKEKDSKEEIDDPEDILS